jgi:hypothetical protein
VKPKYQAYAASVIFGVSTAYVQAVIKDGEVPGHFVDGNPGTRRYTEGICNYKQYFKIGILHRYPGLDATLVEKAFARPELLIDNSFFEQIKKVNVLCQKNLTNFVANRMSTIPDIE